MCARLITHIVHLLTSRLMADSVTGEDTEEEGLEKALHSPVMTETMVVDGVLIKISH